MEKEFVGQMGERAHKIESIRLAFDNHNWFDICAINKLDGFSYDGFAKWVQALHVKNYAEYGDQELKRKAQFYVVNYFLCPEALDPYEVEALMLEVWPAKAVQALKKSTEGWKLACGFLAIGSILTWLSRIPVLQGCAQGLITTISIAFTVFGLIGFWAESQKTKE